MSPLCKILRCGLVVSRREGCYLISKTLSRRLQLALNSHAGGWSWVWIPIGVPNTRSFWRKSAVFRVPKTTFICNRAGFCRDRRSNSLRVSLPKFFLLLKYFVMLSSGTGSSLDILAECINPWILYISDRHILVCILEKHTVQYVYLFVTTEHTHSIKYCCMSAHFQLMWLFSLCRLSARIHIQLFRSPAGVCNNKLLICGFYTAYAAYACMQLRRWL